MKSNISFRQRILTLVLLLRLPVSRTLKSNNMSTFEQLEGATYLQGSSSRTAVDCPVLPPCHCVQSTGQGSESRVRVMCNSTQTGHGGRRVLKFSKSWRLSGREFGHLSLAYSSLNALPAGTFRHIKVLELDLQGNNITRVGSRSLADLKSLLSLNLAWSNISRVSAKAFRSLRLLRNLSLAENRLRRLSSFVFRDLRSLESLTLAGNKFGRLEPDLFRYQSTLQRLDLSYCQLGRIPWTLFSGLWSLQTLDVRGNQLRYLASHTFSELISLQSLLLADNSLTSVDDVNLKGLEHLRVLKLDDNRLRWISPDAFTSTPLLTELDLGENRLSEMIAGTLSSLTQLSQLSLDGNRFKTIPGDVASLTQLQHLDVSYNLIQTVDVCLLEQLSDRLHYFNIRENPFHCDTDCSLQTRLRGAYFRLVKRWVVERRARRGGRSRFQKDPVPLTTAPFIPGKCWTPMELRGSSVVDWKCLSTRRDAATLSLSTARCNEISS